MQPLTLSQLIYKNIATLGFIGYLPFAPGTFGTLAATLFFVLLKPPILLHVFLLLVIIITGTIASHHAEKLLNKKDCRHIVIDEFAGYAVSVIYIPTDIVYYISAFFLFRFFDILKPPPIRNMERIFRGGPGVMADDLMAGIFTNMALQAWIFLIKN